MEMTTSLYNSILASKKNTTYMYRVKRDTMYNVEVEVTLTQKMMS